MEIRIGATEEAEPATVVAGDVTRFTGIVDLLLTVGYIDGLFDQREHAFIQHYVDSVLLLIEQSTPSDSGGRSQLRATWRAHFDELYQRIRHDIADLTAEVMANGDDSYITTRLRVRALSLFRALPAAEQANALELIHALIHADGMLTAPEAQLHAE
ncbi:MAG: hypothetical protein M3680_10985, partial [Myxococcota bacterium]|nr:hypothetical protein [Myxococcota bacterium]